MSEPYYWSHLPSGLGASEAQRPRVVAEYVFIPEALGHPAQWVLPETCPVSLSHSGSSQYSIGTLTSLEGALVQLLPHMDA